MVVGEEVGVAELVGVLGDPVERRVGMIPLSVLSEPCAKAPTNERARQMRVDACMAARDADQWSKRLGERERVVWRERKRESQVAKRSSTRRTTPGSNPPSWMSASPDPEAV